MPLTIAAMGALLSGCLPVNLSASPADETPAAPVDVNPIILGVTPSVERILPAETCGLMCEATDQDGDTLTYSWQASEGTITGEGASVEWRAPDGEGLFRVSVTVDDGRGGSAASSVSLRVMADAAPEVSDLIADPDLVAPEASTYVTCTAVDADDDQITYDWSADAGDIVGEGESVVWVAPAEPGSYWVTVTVSDIYGGSTSRKLAINVAADAVPRLGLFRVKGVNTDLLDLKDGVWDIFHGKSCSIKCNVVDGAEPFTYAWSVDYGALTADGPLAVYVAPEEHGPATVVVDVTDVNGHTTRGTVLLYVQTCSCAFH